MTTGSSWCVLISFKCFTAVRGYKLKIKTIKQVDNEPVYNLTVEKYHNYITSSGLVLKNCDALRYFCVNFTNPAEEPKTKEETWKEERSQRDLQNYINYGVG